MSKLIDSRLVGKSIRSLRLRNHLSQSDLADRIGYSARNIRRIEANGTASIDVVNVFAGYFNVSALDILEGCPFHLLAIIDVIFTPGKASTSRQPFIGIWALHFVLFIE